ncbi:MAG: hypothetical protein JST39_18370 [Bacteroidetes bacterium]|nr:hypothetical protein [Bacteroidota bacterium]
MLTITTLENNRTTGYTGIIITESPAPAKDEATPEKQAFYRIRAAIAASQSIDRNSIHPDSRLSGFFPRRHRRKKIDAFQYELGIELEMTVVRDELEWFVILCTFTSIALLFINWKAAFTSMAFTGLCAWLSAKFGQVLELSTVEQLSRKLAREHYRKPWH